MLELLTASWNREKRKDFKWGECKAPGCQGRWWKPAGLGGWIRLQVPTAQMAKMDKPLDDVKEEDFDG